MVTPSYGFSSWWAVIKFLAVIAYASLVEGIQQDGDDCPPYREDAEHRKVQRLARLTYTILLEANLYDW